MLAEQQTTLFGSDSEFDEAWLTWRGMPDFSREPKLDHPKEYAYVGKPETNQPRFPVFVLTKGRWEKRMTVRLFESLGIPFRLVLEAQEADEYAKVVDPAKFLVVPHRDQGLVTTQNWVWDRAAEEGHPYFWAIHDDIRSIYRVHRGGQIPVDGTALYAMEEFVTRYDNVALAGMSFAMRVWPSMPNPPVAFNGLIPGNHRLVKTDYRDRAGRPFRARDGHGWEDHDLCLRIVKDGGVTVRFNAFVVDTFDSINHTSTGEKVGGIDFGGGYAKRLTDELTASHPDAVIGSRSTKWGVRPTVTYRAWKRNRPRLREDAIIQDGINDFGMTLERRGADS